MSETTTETQYTPMELPQWVQDLMSSWSSDYQENNLANKERIAESIGNTINENYYRQLENASNYSQSYDDNASIYNDLINNLFSKLSSGESIAPEYSTEGEFWTDWTDAKPTSEDFSDYLIDEDYYKDMASELLSKITIGYGDQSTSFIPGKSAEAYGDIVEAMIGNKNSVSKDYGDSNEAWLSNYANVENNLLSMNSNLINQMLAGYESELEAGNTAADKRYDSTKSVYDDYNESLMNYPDGWQQESAWNQQYNYGTPYYYLSYYSTPSSETTKDTGTLGTINDILGTATNVSNTASGLSKAGSVLSNLFSGSGYSGTGGTSSGSSFGNSSDWETFKNYLSEYSF